jgi:putative ABC transport system substrate-binding protein
LGIAVSAVNYDSAPGIEQALSSIAAMRPDGLITVPHLYTNQKITTIANLALEQRLPSLYPRKQYVEVGGLMSYDANREKMWRRAAVFVDKILKGADPATLPVEPPRLELVINLKTAEKIGVSLPPEILLEASEVIK